MPSEQKQTILNLDLSTDPVTVDLIDLSDNRIRIRERKTIPGEIFFHTTLDADENSDAENSETPDQEEIEVPEQDFPSASIEALQEVLDSFGRSWEGSVVTIRSTDYFSLNLELPFQDLRSIQKVLQLEVQDRVPFETDEFLLNPVPLESLNGNGSRDVHVGALPRRTVEQTLNLCHQVSVEPIAICTNASALSAIIKTGSGFFDDNAFIVAFAPDRISASVIVGGIVRKEVNFFMVPEQPEDSILHLRLLINSMENRYSCRIENIYVLGETPAPALLQEHLARPIRYIKTDDFIDGDITNSPVSSFGSLLFSNSPPIILGNFRTGEFGFNPLLKEFLKRSKRLIPYLLSFLLVAIICFGCLFFVRENRIRDMERTIQSQITRLFPELGEGPSGELKNLEIQLTALQTQLENLGSPSQFSPLDALYEVSKTIEVPASASVNRFGVKGEKIKLEMTVSDYKTIDRIKRQLKSNTKIFCRVAPPQTGGPAGNTRVVFEITLCE